MLDKTGTLTEDRVVFTHSVDVDGRPDPAPADAAAVAVRFQTTPRDGLDDAMAAADRDGSALLAHGLLTRVEELPFDHARRRSAVVLRDAHDPGELVIVRGDPDTVLPRCTRVARGWARRADRVAAGRGRRRGGRTPRDRAAGRRRRHPPDTPAAPARRR
ncbi:hypothetical protein [Pseudonocardia sp. ICBG601]|uniref:hypothetical protein n=1 Tax=Pseudonocardia sp. ICBG601 TaxID=2846759 RepID=UPI001CF61829|nr:hypothetical protein [Pseudonocardia sp. ICBG601]